MQQIVDKLLNQEELITSAYHEAGHAVIAWYYGRRILGAFVSRDKNNNSTCEIRRLIGKVPDIEIHELEREMDISMAGVIAEEQLTGKRAAGTDWSGTDYPDAVNIAKDWALKTGKALNDEYLIDQSIDLDGIKGGKWLFTQKSV
jgi:ATP-dependent Zn protease